MRSNGKRNTGRASNGSPVFYASCAAMALVAVTAFVYINAFAQLTVHRVDSGAVHHSLRPGPVQQEAVYVDSVPKGPRRLHAIETYVPVMPEAYGTCTKMNSSTGVVEWLSPAAAARSAHERRICEAVQSGEDPNAWLDYVADHPPPILPSHYARVHGMEPYMLHNERDFQLHAIPHDDWYARAKAAADRCELRLSKEAVEESVRAARDPDTPGQGGRGRAWQGLDHGLDDSVVWVSGLFDLKRDALKGFKRPFKEYIDRFQNVINRGFKMVIFIPAEFEPMLVLDKSRVHVIHMSMAQLQEQFPYYERLQSIRTSPLWVQQGVHVGWLGESPQAMLPDYNPLVMSKMWLLLRAARLNPWGARYHMWMDAGHFCVGEQRPEGTSLYREHMARGMLVTYWPYGTTTEVHGLTDKAMHIYMSQAVDPLMIVRGGIFGGTLPHIECVAKAYTLALHQTLADGYLGTEECIWAIIHKRLAHLFAGFDNDSLGNHGDNCASFLASTMREQAIAVGQAKRFESAPIRPLMEMTPFPKGA